MSLRHVLQASIIALSLSSAPLAAGIFYDCSVEQKRGPGGWISPRLGLLIDDAGAAQIIDALTLHFETGPRPARIRSRGDELRLNWSFSSLADDSSQMIQNFQFQATLDTKSGAFKIRGKPARYPQRVTGVGTCQVRDNLSTKELNRLLRQNSG